MSSQIARNLPIQNRCDQEETFNEVNQQTCRQASFEAPNENEISKIYFTDLSIEEAENDLSQSFSVEI